MGIRIRGLRRLESVLSAVEQFADAEGIADEVGAAMLNRTRRRFLQEEDPDGVPWEPSRAAQARSGGGTLFDTGSLFRSITLLKAGEGVRLITVDPDAENTRTGQPVPEYAVKHQKGLDGLPQRQFLGFGDEDVRVAEKIVQARARRLMGGA